MSSLTTSSKTVLASLIFMALMVLFSSKYGIAAGNVSKSFTLNDDNAKGGCGRMAVNGKLMQEKVLRDLNDAFSLVERVLLLIPKATEPDGEVVRLHLTLFFGVHFYLDSSPYHPNTTDGISDTNYRFVGSM